jgi:hypothetical protein
MTIRVLDEGVYEEGPLLLSQNSRHADLTLESPRRATIRARAGVKNMIEIADVKGVTLRGFRLRQQVNGLTLVWVHGHCPGVLLERLDGDAAGTGAGCVEVGWIDLAPDESPIVVRHCHFRNGDPCVLLTGCDGYQIPRQVVGVSVRENTIEGGTLGVRVLGKANRVQVVGNRVARGWYAGIQLENLMPGAGDILIANNTVFDSQCAFRLWDTAPKGKNIRLCNNLFIGRPGGPDMQFWDNGGQAQKARGFGDGKAVLDVWRMDHNWRELNSDKGWGNGWIPLGAKDRWQSRLDVLSRKPDHPDFLRPAKDSLLTKGGAGAGENPESALPPYVGAVPPEGIEPWDWDRTWKVLVEKIKEK